METGEGAWWLWLSRAWENAYGF